MFIHNIKYLFINLRDVKNDYNFTHKFLFFQNNIINMTNQNPIIIYKRKIFRVKLLKSY